MFLIRLSVFTLGIKSWKSCGVLRNTEYKHNYRVPTEYRVLCNELSFITYKVNILYKLSYAETINYLQTSWSWMHSVFTFTLLCTSLIQSNTRHIPITILCYNSSIMINHLSGADQRPQDSGTTHIYLKPSQLLVPLFIDLLCSKACHHTDMLTSWFRLPIENTRTKYSSSF